MLQLLMLKNKRYRENGASRCHTKWKLVVMRNTFDSALIVAKVLNRLPSVQYLLFNHLHVLIIQVNTNDTCFSLFLLNETFHLLQAPPMVFATTIGTQFMKPKLLGKFSFDDCPN